MVRTVYVDLLFLINFSMDFLCFFLTTRLFSRPFPIFRVLLSSVLGGIYSVLSLFWSFRGLLLLLFDIGICAVMCLVVFLSRSTSPSRMTTEILLYTGISMALGGIMTAAYSILNQIGAAELLTSDSDGISSWIFLLLAVVGGGATLLGSKFFRRDSVRKYFTVTVGLCGKERSFRAVIDTGNSLSDPITGLSAAAVGVNALNGLLPSEICRKGVSDPVSCFSSLSGEYRTRARLLPVRTVTGEGMLLAFRADFCYICPIEAERTPSEWEERELLIALCSEEFEGAEMLLPVGIY